MDNNRFHFGFWNYAPFKDMDLEEHVRLWKECGIDLPMSFLYQGEKDKEKMVSLLKACERYGLSLILSDKRTSFRNYREKGEAIFRKEVKEAYQEFSSYPSLFGFFAGDEPLLHEQKEAIETVKILKEEMPNLTPFMNLLPYYAGCDWNNEIGKPASFFDQTLSTMLEKARPSIIGYDQYTQLLEEGYNQEDGINSYYYGLDRFHELTSKYDCQCLVSLLCVGHWYYRNPTKEDIRWQISTAVSHGMKGIIWFYFYPENESSSFKNSPFTGERLEKTPMYDMLKEEQNHFLVRYGTLVPHLTLKGVYHIGNLYDPRHRLTEDDWVSSFSSFHNGPFIVSYYEDERDHRKYVSVTNASQTRSNRFTLGLRDGSSHTTFLSPGDIVFYPFQN